MKVIAVKKWQAAAQILSSTSDTATISLGKMTTQFIEGPWLDVAFNRGWVPLELLCYSDAPGAKPGILGCGD
jgi:hypothetical protein